jgi:hypothetical protein
LHLCAACFFCSEIPIAINSFHLARLLNPADPRLDFGLAAALAVRAIGEERPHDLLTLELLLRAAELAPPAGRSFNLALVLENAGADPRRLIETCPGRRNQS